MAGVSSFDISTGADLQEVDNAVNQARKEIAQRYDFKGTRCTIDYDRKSASITLEADDDYRLKALWDVLHSKLVRRKVPTKNVTVSDPEPAAGARVRQRVALQQGIPADTARKIVKDIKDQKMKKVQAAIQGDEVRVSSPSRDSLQAVIEFLRGQDYGVELQVGNYRG
ncbi:MAG: YajQ family cyclic di-GMP-binding protein [Gemmatimonadales bacterium]